MKIIIATVVLAVASMLTACTSPVESSNRLTAHDGSGGDGKAVSAEASDALPSDTLRDWVTYAEFLVDAEATGETRIEPSSSEKAAGQSIATRQIRLVVKSVLWTSGREKSAPAAMSFPVGGWLLEPGKEERQLALLNTVRFEPGQRYLVPIMRDPQLYPSWAPISARASAAFNEGVVGRGEVVRTTNGNTFGKDAAPPAIATLWGLSRSAVVTKLGQVSIDPLARGLNDLSPAARYARVLELLESREPTEAPRQ